MDPETGNVISVGQKEEFIFYREEKTETEYKTYKEEINKIQEEVIKELEKLKTLITQDLKPDIVYKLLLNLRYLVKHVAFKEEQECRIIKVKRIAKDDENINIKIEPSTNRFYVDYLPLNQTNVTSICFGPKAKEIDKYRQHLIYNGYREIKCHSSTSPLG